AVAQVLALTNSKPAQSAMVTVAIDEKTTDDAVKVNLLHGAAESVKNFGPQLDPALVTSAQKLVMTPATTPDVRSAAAELVGALNLQPELARTLILNQSKVRGTAPAAGGPA